MPNTLPAAPEASTAGLLAALAAALPDPACPLGRRARRLADRLSHGARTRALSHRAADLLAVLLDATDAGLALPDDNCLDDDFDGLGL